MKTVLVILLALAPVARADTPQTVDAAQAEGFAPRPDDEPAGSLFGGVLAVGPGFLIHGFGHYYAGAKDTALSLLLAELAGLGLIAASLAIDESTHGSGPTGGLRLGLAHAGAVLFFGSWGADIFGTFKGAGAFDPLTLRTEARQVGLAYRFTDNPLTPFKHHIAVKGVFDSGLFYLRPEVDLEARLDLWQGAVDTGVRVFRGVDPQNYIAVGARARRHAVRRYGYSALASAAYVGGQADLGQVVRGMRNCYVFTRLGYGFVGYQFGDQVDEAPGFTESPWFLDSWLLVETGVAVNTGPRTTASLAFIEDPTQDVGPSDGENGLIEVALSHRQSAELDIELSLTAGEGWGIRLGLGYGL
ncbi:MAG: hypothetical protein H6706_15115 [Myxococcales bacterium]|nr:hypothetical protein [Myxococcales bacterium]